MILYSIKVKGEPGAGRYIRYRSGLLSLKSAQCDAATVRTTFSSHAISDALIITLIVTVDNGLKKVLVHGCHPSTSFGMCAI